MKDVRLPMENSEQVLNNIRLLLRSKMHSGRNMDYSGMDDVYRLFPKRNDNEVIQNPNTSNTSIFRSPFNQTAMGNRSSSSADSTSPESYPDLSSRYNSPGPTHESYNLKQDHYRPFDNFRPFIDTPRYDIPRAPVFDTPRSTNIHDNFTIRRQRPIVGRKILGKVENTSPVAAPISLDYDFDCKIWQPEEQSTPPNSGYAQNYELFPTEPKIFQTPIKTSPTMSYSTISPSTSTTSSIPTFRRSPMQYRPSFQSPTFSQASRSIDPQTMCTFCKKNGETPVVYMTHTVKERVGNRQIVTCPILRSHECRTCGATGDDAHTITYCPVLRSTNNGQPLQSTTITLKNTRIKSNGRRRY